MVSHADGHAAERPTRGSTRRPRGRLPRTAVSAFVAALATISLATPAPLAAAPTEPDFGPNVKIFDPSMSTAEIKAAVDAIAAEQISNQFGTQRYAVLFKPGTYGSAADPLNFQVGYYTEVAGLGSSPSDVTVNGTIDVYNQCFGPGDCTALENFWRSAVEPDDQRRGQGWLPVRRVLGDVAGHADRRVHVNGFTTLMDYCSAPSFASGGFIADSQFSGSVIVNGSQQQYLVRNSVIDTWTNGVWNQVFAGVVGAPAQSFPDPPYTTLDTNPAVAREAVPLRRRERPFNVFVPDVRFNSPGHDLAGRPDAGPRDPDRRLLRREAVRQRQVDQQRARAGEEPPLHPGHLQRRPDDQGEAAGHGRARARPGDARGGRTASCR